MTDEAAPRRADAVRNRERVIAAAATVFAQSGTEAGVPEIAALAGVGKATVYRSFPTKEHLIAAIVIERIHELELMVRAQLGDPDPWGALQTLLGDSAERHCADRAITAAISSASDLPELMAARASFWEAIEALMVRAKEQGRMRDDVNAADLRVLWAGTVRLLMADGVDDPRAWRRYAALVLDALRA